MARNRDERAGQVGSTKPYLIRALYEWCVDQGFTPYLSVVVDALTQVPKPYVKEGQIVLNLSPEAVHQLVLGNDYITLSARFGGVSHPVSVPVGRVAAIYARENGNGMAFEIEQGSEAAETPPASEAEGGAEPSAGGEKKSPRSKSGGKPHLTRVK